MTEMKTENDKMYEYRKQHEVQRFTDMNEFILLLFEKNQKKTQKTILLTRKVLMMQNWILKMSLATRTVIVINRRKKTVFDMLDGKNKSKRFVTKGVKNNALR